MFYLLCVALLSGCIQLPAAISMEPAATPNPVAVQQPPDDDVALVDTSPETPFPAGALVAGVDIGGLDHARAAEQLQSALNSIKRPIELRLDEASLILYPDEIQMEIPVESLLAMARSQAESGQAVNVPLEVQFNTLEVSRELSFFASQTAIAPTITISSTSTISRSFAYTPGRSIDVNETILSIKTHLRSPGAGTAITLQRRADLNVPKTVTSASFNQLAQQIEDLADTWNGVVGFYLYDLESGETVALNENTIFSGASVMKVAIMLQIYTSLPSLTKQQQRWIAKMIVESDNKAANALLAASAGGTTVEDALTGVRQMNNTLHRLGLQHTFQKMPYATRNEFPELYEAISEDVKPSAGTPPYTETDPIIQTTPAEMSRVFLLIEQCSRGKGDLLNLFVNTLTPQHCQEMLTWLAKNEDTTRMRAGMPPDVRVEHKSGWIEDMQADVGIVRSPGGDFLLAIYLYEDISLHDDPKHYLDDKRAGPMIAAFARIAYTAYNPIELQ